ncbi:adenosylmethionine decarboxylase [Lignipirellula cremea]|uniref:S-adenosylmethionine decarboxylase proenzyme n=1 Tax=Lignipirellula cremea TaxID=2528010 RepID=A0A518E0H5_9BACT|nr:adenosylmethionine decarboxylase [Lignipirellula cremea]QDU97585.1 S-adenosylmethionine decarboxylase proenzyme precursor [Lignipirellula cremea]
MHNPASNATPVGRHLLADFYGVAPEPLRDESLLTSLLLRVLGDSGFHILSHRSAKFPGEESGATVMVLLSESHATIHTYPEFGYAAIDIFSCGDSSPEQALAGLQAALEPQECQISTHARGRLPVPDTRGTRNF